MVRAEYVMSLPSQLALLGAQIKMLVYILEQNKNSGQDGFTCNLFATQNPDFLRNYDLG